MAEHDVSDFQRQVIDRSHEVPVLVDFWAAWCGPCRMLGPVLEGLATAADGRWELAKLDTEAHPDVAARYDIRSIPAVKLFVDGEPVDEFVGALPEPAVREWLEEALPNPARARLEQARKAAAEGDIARAEQLLEALLGESPDDPAAGAELARLLVWRDPERAHQLVAPLGAGSPQAEVAESVRQIAALFERLERPDSLPEAPVRSVYLAAIAALRAADIPSALDGFLTVIARDRTYDDDGARRACLAVFRLLGDNSPLTRGYRPLFASAVYA